MPWLRPPWLQSVTTSQLVLAVAVAVAVASAAISPGRARCHRPGPASPPRNSRASSSFIVFCTQALRDVQYRLPASRLALTHSPPTDQPVTSRSIFLRTCGHHRPSTLTQPGPARRRRRRRCPRSCSLAATSVRASRGCQCSGAGGQQRNAGMPAVPRQG